MPERGILCLKSVFDLKDDANSVRRKPNSATHRR
jgi:hypothetical protein